MHIHGTIPPYDGFDASYILPRERVDEALLTYVLSREPEAVTFYEGHTLVDLVRGPAGKVAGAVVQHEDNGEHRHPLGGVRRVELHAPLVIGADGRMSTLARLLGTEPYDTRESATTLYYSYCRGVDWGGLSDLLFLGAHRQRLVVMSEVAPDVQVISTFFPVEQFGEFRRDREAELRRSWQRVPELEGRMDHVELLGQVQGLTPQPGYFRPAGGPGWALVGDAAHFKDPASGQGFHDALFTVEQFLDAVDGVNAGGPLSEAQATREWPGAAGRMQHTRDRALRPMYAFTYAFGEALTQPPNILQRGLLQTLAADRAAAEHFLGIASGATDIAAFQRAAPGYFLRSLLTYPPKAERECETAPADGGQRTRDGETPAHPGNHTVHVAPTASYSLGSRSSVSARCPSAGSRLTAG
jgi:2-polyprenyl-6-methoxyphenol hydroxylase-like FAD-dependent oxidoreductase